MKRVLTAMALALTASGAFAQDRPPTPPWTEDAKDRAPAKLPEKPKVALAWDRYYHLDELHDALRQLAAAWPQFVELRSIGKSVEGRDLLLAVVTDRVTGSDAGKTAFWCDGNIHGNEVQGGEVCLYLVWWLCENRDRLPKVRTLLAERAFYVLPSLNPDGRAHWFDAPNTMHSSRGGKRPVDNDRDGLFDEDGPNDLDGDGEILEMRVEDADGDWKPDPENPRLMVRCEPGERGKWRRLDDEGVDDDGDGRVNEDGPGGYDPNRDWPSDWRTSAEQGGAGPYPGSLPETRAVTEFLAAHANVAGFQSFHNNGGMVLRGPGAQSFGAYPEKDDRVLRAIAARGEEQLPFYRSMQIWKDLYQVFGGEVNYAYEMLGVVSFTNELWNDAQYRGREPGDKERGRERLRFDDDVELGARRVDWKPFEHPQLGRIEIGGWRRETGRVPPPFMIEEMLHRNMAFVLYHAAQMPIVRTGDLALTTLPGELNEYDVVFRNDGMIPTRTQRAADKKIGAPDRVTVVVEEGDLEVLSGGVVDPATNRVVAPDLRRPADLRLPNGIDGNGAVRLRWLLRGKGTMRVTYRAEKGGTASVEIGAEVTAGVVFDLDGVLIDSEGLWYRAATRFLAEFGVSVTPEEYGRDWIASGEGPELAVARYRLPITAEEFRRRRRPMIERMLAEEARLMPGALAALQRLSAHHPLAVATNSNAAWVAPLLDRLALRRYFKDVLTRERYARAKPEPDAFLAAAASLGLLPARCVVIEDAERGVLAAHRAGTRCIAVPNSWTKTHDFSLADRVLANLDAVTPALISELAGAPTGGDARPAVPEQEVP